MLQKKNSKGINLLDECFRNLISILIIKLYCMVKEPVVRVFRVRMSEKMASGLKDLVSEWHYASYVDAIRYALAKLIEEIRPSKIQGALLSSR